MEYGWLVREILCFR